MAICRTLGFMPDAFIFGLFDVESREGKIPVVNLQIFRKSCTDVTLGMYKSSRMMHQMYYPV